MKKFVTLLLVSIVVMQHAFANDRYVDPSAVPGAMPNTYATILAALASCANGDRVFVTPGNYTSQTITVNKSVTILSSVSGSTVNITSGFSIDGFPGMKLQFIGINCGTTTANVGTATSTNRAKVYMVDCAVTGDLNFDQNYYELTCVRTNIANTTYFRNGSFVASKTTNLTVNSEPSGGNVADTISKNFIVADSITGILNYKCDNIKFVIANNLLNEVYIYAWNYYSGNMNYVLNNEFVAGAKLAIPVTNVPYYNLDISNNLFTTVSFPVSISVTNSSVPCYTCNIPQTQLNYNTSSISNYSATGQCYQGSPYYQYYNYNCASTVNWADNNSCKFPNIDIPGVFRWTYNGFTIAGSGTQGNLAFANVAGQTATVNGGNPANMYYDIDLTVNDRGRLGGPYSTLNYQNSSNPNNSKSFIFDLEIPNNLQPASQNVKIKARGYHRN